MLRRVIFLLVLLAQVLWTSGANGETFRNPIRIPTTSDPTQILTGDVNNDGLLDILWVDSSSRLHILLAQHAGGYLPGTDLVLQANGFCRLFDANADGNLDLACVTGSGLTASVLLFLGHGDATFAAPRIIALPPSNGNYFYPVLSIPLDLNGDALPDLVVTDSNNDRSYVLLGDATAGFRVVAKELPASVSPVAAVDLNGDGIPDLLFANGPTVALGNGDGTFSSIHTYSQPFDYTNVCAFHDMDGDGHLDAICGYLAVVDGGDIIGQTDLIVLHGNPDGTFNETPLIDQKFGDRDTEHDGSGNFLVPLLIGDLNGDGIPDILAYAGDGFTVLLGGPSLTFSSPRHFAVGTIGNFPGATANYADQIVDLNGDGIPDVVASGTNSILISLGKPDGSFDTAPSLEVAEVVGYTTVGDFNGDGIPDLVATGDTSLRLSLGKGDGTFLPYTSLPKGNINFGDAYHIAHGDFNGDGKQDILAIGSSSVYQYDKYLLFGHGDGSFDPPRLVTASSTTYPQFTTLEDGLIFDLNHDGRSDFVSTDNGVLTGTPNHIDAALSNGDGTFRYLSTPIPTEPLPSAPTVFNSQTTQPALADFNEDGQLDAVAGSFANAYVLRGHGDGTFESNGATLLIPALPPLAGNGVVSVAAGDFDGDGHQDVAVLANFGVSANAVNSGTYSGLFVYFGYGDGTFSHPSLAAQFNRAYAKVSVADLNQDGLADLILYDGGNYASADTFFGIVHTLPGRTFAPEVNYVIGPSLSDLAITDVNRDGLLDLVIGNGGLNGGHAEGIGSATVLLNLGNTPAVTGTLYATPEPSAAGQSFTLTAVLTPPSPGTLAGSLSFSIDGVPTGSAPLANNAATLFLTSSLSIGTHSLSATWPGDAIHPALTLAGRHIVTGLASIVTLTSSVNPSQASTSVTFTARVAATTGASLPTGSVTFTDGTAMLATIPLGSGSLAAFTTSSLSIGSHPIAATYTGDAVFASSSALLVQVVEGLTTTLNLTALPNPAFVGQIVLLSASAFNAQATPTGIFTFTDGPAVLRQSPLDASGSSKLSVAFTSVGAHMLSANYSGDITHLSNIATATEQVLAGSTTTTIGSSSNPISAGAPLTLTATVAPGYSSILLPSGTVTFRDAGIVVATVPLIAGVATYSTSLLTPGTHSLTAGYSGSAQFGASSSPILQQVVTLAVSAMTLSASPNPGYQGQNVSFSATLSAPFGLMPTGTVQFLDGSTQLFTAAVTNASVSFTTNQLSPGRHSITAVYSGNATLAGITSAPLIETILLSDFSLSATPAALSLRTGHHTTFTLTATSSGAFADSVLLTFSGLPAHATITFPKGPLAHLTPGASVSTSVYLDTDDVIGYLSQSQSPANPSLPRRQKFGVSLGLVIFPMGALTLFGLFRRRRHLTLFCAAFLLITLGGCSGMLPASTTPGSYTIHLNATGNTTKVVHPLDISLTVTE